MCVQQNRRFRIYTSPMDIRCLTLVPKISPSQSRLSPQALTMSNESRKDTTVGEIVNLMSVDAQRLQDVTGYLWMIWSCPLQIAIAIYMLWGIVGPSALAGLAVMILLIPINGVMATYQRKLQINQMKQKDQRIKLMNEVLNGMKVGPEYRESNS